MSSFLKFPRIREAWEDRNEPEGLRALATAFWRGLVVVAFLALLCALWFGSQELDAASQAENVKNTYAAPRSPFDPAQLQSTLAAFSARQSEYQSLSTSPLPSVADPSSQ
ncbi:MAG TPA: hypothetical protein VG102_00585 [Candidatus Paceibacterota bacterium]|jgi:hypothetical protein|nr:hypothetical protein [Candidatus Paceibacterota bacterium]